MQVPPPPLSSKTGGLIREWFQLVDGDRSGALNTLQLAAALRVSQGCYVCRAALILSYVLR